MIIEFPAKYHIKGSGGSFTVSIPRDLYPYMVAALRRQPWINGIYPDDWGIDVFVSRAYEISERQAIDALSRLCEFVMSPPVEMSKELEHEIEEVLGEIPQ